MDDLVIETVTLVERRATFQLWVETVRDPAQEVSEGIREVIVLNGAATASYEIAPLPDGRWAVTVRCEYHCGHCHGAGIPWTEFPIREDCLEFFLNTARRHFGQPVGRDGSEPQRNAQTEMRRLLTGGLFGFIEPTPSRGYEEQAALGSFNSERNDGAVKGVFA